MALILILFAGAFMIWDFYYHDDKNQGNIYEYDLKDFKSVKDDLIGYEQVGQLETGLEKVKAIAIDDKDRVYVAGSGSLVIFDRQGEKVQEFAVSQEVNCLTVDPSGTIYLGVSDHIEVVDFSGNNLAVWDPPGGRTMFTSLAVNEEALFVADAGNKVVQKYNLEGQKVLEIGRRSKAKGDPGFIIPSPYFDLLLGREGELWVVNPGMHALQAYNDAGEKVSSWKRTSMQLDGFSGCCNPSHIAMLSNGSFVTSEKGIERVKIHLPSGDFECVVASPETFEAGTVGLDLAVDSADRIYVLDTKSRTVRIYSENSAT